MLALFISSILPQANSPLDLECCWKKGIDMEKESCMNNYAVPVKLITSSLRQSWNSSMQNHLVDFEWWTETKCYSFRLRKASKLPLGQLDPGKYRITFMQLCILAEQI